MRVLVFQNYPCEDAGSVAEAFEQAGCDLLVVDCYRGAPPPSPSSANAVVVMGGPMNVYEDEKYPFLAWETRWLREWIQAGGPVLGLCLGAQLISRAMGGRVARNPMREIGHHQVDLTDTGCGDPVFFGFERQFYVVQWHSDTFSVPEGGIHLARSRLCENQAFRVGRAIGLQFHLEIDRRKMGTWVSEYSAEAEEEGIAPGDVLEEFGLREDHYRAYCRRFVRNFCASECGVEIREE